MTTTLSKINPCLWFDTQAEEAANLYVSVFPDACVVRTTHYGSAGPRPEGMVMTVNVQILGIEFVLLNGGPEFTFDEATSFQVNCGSQDEVDYYWDKLAEGGEHGPCGWLKDRFGVSWQIIPTVLDELIADPNPARAQAAMKAMLGMSKLEIAELQRAADAA